MIAEVAGERAVTSGSGASAPARGPGRPGYDIESLLAVAVAVFNERGYDGTSMEELSRRLGITKSAIYYHVRSKEELLRMGLDRALDGLFAAAAEAVDADLAAIDQLERLVRSSVAVLTEQLPYVTLLLRVRGNTDVQRRALERRRQFDRIVSGLVREAEAQGDIRPEVDPVNTSRLLFGMVNSIVEWYRPGAAGGAQRLTETVCAMAFDGLRIRRPG